MLMSRNGKKLISNTKLLCKFDEFTLHKLSNLLYVPKLNRQKRKYFQKLLRNRKKNKRTWKR